MVTQQKLQSTHPSLELIMNFTYWEIREASNASLADNESKCLVIHPWGECNSSETTCNETSASHSDRINHL